MNNQNIEAMLLTDDDLATVKGGGDILAANDPTFIPADPVADKPRKPTADDHRKFRKWRGRPQ